MPRSGAIRIVQRALGSALLAIILVTGVVWSAQGESWRDSRLEPAAQVLLEAGLDHRNSAFVRKDSARKAPFPPADAALRRGWFLDLPLGLANDSLLARVRWRQGERWLLDLTPRELADLLPKLDPVRVHVERSLKPCLDLALPLSRVDLVQAGTAELDRPYGGTGVLVGIIDSGIDPAHQDFWKDGRCRILHFRDQVEGGDYNRAQLETGQAGNRDPLGHGTHVAGIAAGNGSSAPGGAGGGPFIGYAPLAELLVVRSTLNEGDILSAAEWIFARATELGRPCVLNLSLETHMGAHDGSSVLEDGLEAMSGPGRLLVCAAGNSAQSREHHSGAYNASRTVVFTSVTGQDVFLDVWIQSPDAPQASLQLPDGSLRSAGQPAGTQAGWYVQMPSPVRENGRWHVILRLDQGEAGAEFQLRLNHATPGFRSLHAWGDGLSCANPDSTSTLGIPATGDSMLVAGSLLHRRSWRDESGQTWQYQEGVVDEASPFSARGPRVDGLQRPQVLMPGQGVFSAMSSFLADDASQSRYRHVDGRHILRQGTSMAAPALSGLVALALERDPELSYQALDSLLRSAAGEPWTADRGCGVPDAVALLSGLRGGLRGLVVEPGLDEMRLDWILSSNWDGAAQNLVRSQANRDTLIWTGAAAAGAWSVTDTTPPAGVFSYRVELRDQEGALLDSLGTGPVRLLEVASLTLLAAWPNPGTGQPLTLEMLVVRPLAVKWELRNLVGAHCAGGNLGLLQRGRQRVVLQLPGRLAAGRYYLSVSGGGESATCPVTLLR